MSRFLGRDDRLGNGWALVDLGDFKSLSRAMPSEVGSIPTHSRHQSVARRRVASDVTSPKFERRPLHTPKIVVVTAVLVVGAAMPVVRAAAGPARTAADSAAARTRFAAHDRGERLAGDSGDARRGRRPAETPEEVKAMLERMGSSEVAGAHRVGAKEEPEGRDAVQRTPAGARTDLQRAAPQGRSHGGLHVTTTSAGRGSTGAVTRPRSRVATRCRRAVRRTSKRTSAPTSGRKKRAPICGGRVPCGWSVCSIRGSTRSSTTCASTRRPRNRRRRGFRRVGGPGSYVTIGFDLKFVK